jgi:hypothetical protein
MDDNKIEILDKLERLLDNIKNNKINNNNLEKLNNFLNLYSLGFELENTINLNDDEELNNFDFIKFMIINLYMYRLYKLKD